MILYLFGGSSPENEKKQCQLIRSSIDLVRPSQILYLGFAHRGESGARGQLFRILLKTTYPDLFLDAENQEDLERSVKPLVFVDGGHNKTCLKDSVLGNDKLLGPVTSADYYFGESAGASFAGEYYREGGEDVPLTGALNLLPGIIVEPHYSQRNRQKLLREEMKSNGVKIGIGIDEAGGIKIDPALFPEEYEVIGDGLVEVITT